MKKRTFYFAKINIHGNIFSPDLEDLIAIHIPRVIKEVNTIKLSSYNWSFTDLKEINILNSLIIHGNVTKSKHAKQKIKDGKKTYEKRSDDELAETAYFVYDLNNEILVFETNSKITIDAFITFFTRLLSQDTIIGEVIIKPIPIQYEIIKQLLSFDKVTQISFELIHPNPGKKEFNSYNELIHGANLKKLDITMSNTEEGIKLSDQNNNDVTNPIITDGIDLVERGYGEIDIIGENYTSTLSRKNKKKTQTKKRKFSSKKSIKKLSTYELENDKVLVDIVKSIQKLFI